nr:CBS domain-containing protein [Anaerolineae bacterium]
MANYDLRARDIMQVEIATILGDATARDAAELMRLEGVRSLIIIPRSEGDPFAIITYSDIVKKVIASEKDPTHVTIDSIMTKPVITIPPDMQAKYIARLIQQTGVGHLPVVEGSTLVGMVSMTDLITEVITEPT